MTVVEQLLVLKQHTHESKAKIIDAAIAHIDQLQQQLTAAEKRFDLKIVHLRTLLEHNNDHCREHIKMIEDDELLLTSANTKLEAARLALDDYAWHHPACPCHDDVNSKETCSCGYTATMKDLGVEQ